MTTVGDRFRVCSTCRRDIPFEATYYVCSVSTCNRPRTGLLFCSMPCWDAHLPEARHREAWAEERSAPTREAWALENARADDTEPVRRVVVHAAPRPTARPAGEPATPAPRPGAPSVQVSPAAASVPRDVLVVISKLKAYVRARHGMNTSDAVVDILSDHLRRLCDQAAAHAAGDGRKTVLERDLPRPGRMDD